MGLLSNVEARSKVMRVLTQKGHLLTLLSFVSGVVWFALITHPHHNGRVYFSENALLPGLVQSRFTGTGLDSYYTEYQNAMKALKDKSKVPTDWLMKELQSIGLEVYEQKYQFDYPMNLMNNRTADGTNVYALLRAPRAASTEAMVMTAPLRPVDSGMAATDGSVALMLSLAKYMIRQTYWSKDIIFLFPQHEYVGVQAWLDGYLSVSTSKFIRADRLEARGGIIQAAVNLEFSSLGISDISVKIEGINGVLPNLDLVNLVHKLAREGGVKVTFHGRENQRSREKLKVILHNLQTAYLMMSHQATGMATGNHGLFLRYRIDALTITGKSGQQHRLRTVGDVVEGVFRSINNLLEALHQSFFFYILPSTDRYISIGVYMPPFALIAVAGLIQALALWGNFTDAVASRDDNLRANKDKAFTADGRLSEESLRMLRIPDNIRQGLTTILPMIVCCQLAGLVLNRAPEFFSSGEIKNLPTAQAVLLGSLAWIVSTLLIARIVTRKEEFENMNWQLMKCLAMIFYSLALFSLSLLNISLAVILAVCTLPVYCIVRPVASGVLTILQAAALIVASPLGVLVLSTALYSHMSGGTTLSNLTFAQVLTDVHDSLIYGLVDHFVFNNFTFDLVSLVLYPVWLMMWSVIWMNT